MLIPGIEFKAQIEELIRSVQVRRDLWPMMVSRYPLEVSFTEAWVDVYASVEKGTNKLLGFLDFSWTNGRLAVESALMMRTDPHNPIGQREFGNDVFHALELCFDRGAWYVSWGVNKANESVYKLYEKMVKRGWTSKVGEFPGKYLGMDGRPVDVHTYAMYQSNFKKYKEEFRRS